MADNKLELVVEVDTNRANASIKSVNTSLSSMEATAAKSARGATQGIDGMTAAMVKGATAGNLFADAIKSAVTWAKEFTVGSVMMAAENAKAEASLKALATAHGVGAAAATKQVAAIEEIGFEFTEAAHAVQRLIIADMDLAKAEGLAKLAKNAAAVQNVSAGEAMEAIVLAIESGASRGLRTLGLFVDFQKEAQIAQLQLGRSLTETEEKQLRYNAVMREGAKIQGAHAAASRTVEAPSDPEPGGRVSSAFWSSREERWLLPCEVNPLAGRRVGEPTASIALLCDANGEWHACRSNLVQATHLRRNPERSVN